jgi:hypothetical protein
MGRPVNPAYAHQEYEQEEAGCDAPTPPAAFFPVQEDEEHAVKRRRR